ncbi:ParA family protein [[Clostridium] innocuum]|mgnify:CR=1 FL=1|nr:ParA family protein [[Clostridium] innocuum]
MAKKIMAYSSKGGSGKSTSLLTIGKTLSKKGYKVCLIDVDPQANLSNTLLKDKVFEDDYISIADLFKAKLESEKVEKAIQNVDENLDMIGSAISLVESEQLVRSNALCDQSRVLEKILNCIEVNYDIILMDFNPYPSLLTTNGLMASDFVIIPTTCDEWGADGVIITLSQIYQVQEGFGKNISYKVLVNMKGRNNDDKKFEESIASQLSADEIFKTSIHFQAKPFKNKDESVIDFKHGNTTVGKEWQAVIDELESEVIING